MKYYSEILNETFDTEAECLYAELEYKKAEEAKVNAEAEMREALNRAKEIMLEAARAYAEAKKNYYDLLKEYDSTPNYRLMSYSDFLNWLAKDFLKRQSD